ncbi:glycerophosphodiester phosphodiesterase family protein [Lactobacillus sp. Sy-1]|uniref:glycerophosphodiester phosphodiesterase family protein n=1 Tax=Lactobacillus sp. Sy-1 TaxID=2109645 RepID=UPI001C5B80E2|nr:glycerophosphodiester phosphodiesterase family protein [Lactobacillus sp. Sy-1]MBW1606225.1 glycerophosphodiester phosphodiesterase [Lactobacillus sp. Sy-1]
MNTMVFAHRGIPTREPENSLSGFKYCLEHGAAGLEFDIHLTKDNVPVVMHDEKIDRTTDGSGLINSYTYEELCQFKLANGERIPKLDELIALVENQDIWLNLEFKTNKIHYPGIEKIVLQKMNAAALKHHVIYSSFNIDSLRVAKILDENQDYNFLFEKKLNDPAKVMKAEGLNGLHPGYYIPGLESHERIWTIDDPKEQEKLFKAGVAGIFTNDFVSAEDLKNQILSKSTE